MKIAIWATLILAVGIHINTTAQGIEMLDNVVESNGVYTLVPGPNVDGLVLVQQVNRGEDDWPEKPVRVLETVPWIDAASIRIGELGDTPHAEILLRIGWNPGFIRVFSPFP